MSGTIGGATRLKACGQLGFALIRIPVRVNAIDLHEGPIAAIHTECDIAGNGFDLAEHAAWVSVRRTR